jgi:hypothetical protein
MVKSFEFSFDELEEIAKAHPEAVKEDDENIRFCSYFSVDDGKTWQAGAVKCGECNWEVDRLFVQAESREDAIQLLVEGEAGLCGDCYGRMLVDADRPTAAGDAK